ncbi:hypothetical protein F4777DRAFT_299238 [Nemania sp. FL0916]|nr:hypothetical protein F4777DRAFT_299238 [Nemania sp. FL0916]
MNNLSRHIACKLCRDRKVRCDGGQPSCEKCRRSGETCIYVPTHKPTKADLAQTIESLQERLDKAEAYILRHSNTSKPTAVNEQPPIASPNSTMGTEYPDCLSFNLQMPTTITNGDPFMSHGMHGMPSTPFSHHSLPMSPENMDGEFMHYIPSPSMTIPHPHSHPHEATHSHFHMDDPRRIPIDDMSGPSTATASSSSSFRRDSVYSHSHSHRRMPSLREVRIVNGAATCTTSPPPSPSGRGYRADDANHILAELTAFGMAVFSTQAEIAGISSVVAEYLEWIRKTPPTTDEQQQQQGQGLGLVEPKANPAAVLEALETRVRELNALAGTRHMDAWRQSVHRLERIPGVGAMLNLFDHEMQRRSGETAEFFCTGYDICSPLPGQLGRKE